MKSQLKPQQPPNGQKDGLKGSLVVRHACHFKGELKQSLFLQVKPTKQNRLIYPAANMIVCNELSGTFENDKTQTFIPSLTGTKQIVCMTQSQNKRYLAWSEETQGIPVISLIDLHTQAIKRVAIADIKGNRYVSLAFNGNEISDPKFLVGLTNGPQYQLLIWNIEKGNSFVHNLEKSDKMEKPQTNLNQEKFTKIFFYRQEDALVAMGKGNLKFFKISMQKLQPKDSPFARRQINEKDFTFTAFCITKDGLIIGTDTGDLLYFAVNGEFRAILSTSPGQNYVIETLLYLPKTGKSFIAAGSDELLVLYEKSESKDTKNVYVRSNRKINLGQHRGRLTSLLATPKQDELFVGVHTGLILRVSLDKNQESKCDHAIQPFHTDSITGLDVCLRKSLVATCSGDRTVRIWNYLEKNSLEVIKQFEEKPLSLSFHPSGLHLLVSFPDKVRLINILESELLNFKDLSIKNCYQVRFSHGGHLFATVNNVMVQLFNFYTLDQPPHYQFKAQAGKFQTMIFEQDDLAVYLGTSDGYVFYYKLEDHTVRLQILVVPGLSVRTIACMFVGKDQKQGLINERTVFVGGTFTTKSDTKCIYEIKITPKPEKDKQREGQRDDQSKYTISQPNRILTDCNVSKIILFNSKKVFAFATDEPDLPGKIRYCRYPLGSGRQGTGRVDVHQLNAHSKRINALALTFDDNYLFSVGRDGQFLSYDLRDKDSKSKVEMPDFSEEFLYSKQKLVLQKRQQDQLRERNAQAKEKKQRSIRETRAENDRLVVEWNFKIGDRQRSEKEKYDLEIEEISRMEKEQMRKLSALQTEHKEKREAVEKDYSDKIQLEQTRFSQLGKTRQSDAKKFNEIKLTICNNHVKKKQKKEQEFREQLEAAERQLKELDVIYDRRKKEEYEKDQARFEQQAEKQIKAEKEKNQIIIKDLQNQNKKAQAQKMEQKNLYDGQQRDLDQERHTYKNTLEDIEKIRVKNDENQQKKKSQAKEISEREKTIRDKMIRINELKKKTQELEKFKFVLDYKIKELKRDILPREQQINKMKEQIANMNAQIVHFKRTNENMNLIVKDLTSKRSGMEKELETLSKSEEANLSFIKSFEYDISDMYQNTINDYKQMKAKVVEVYRKYIQDENRKKMEGIDQQKEFIKERAHLESTVKGLKDKFKKSIDLHDAENKRIMSQNEELTSEINDLKREKKFIMDENRKKQQQKEEAAKLFDLKAAVEKEHDAIEKTLRDYRASYEEKVHKRRPEMESK